jgi:nitrite reductase/ring-hydroxylating ferredoxin subunit
MAYRPLAKLIDLHDGYRRAFRLEGREVLLLQHDGERYLLDRHCPHAGQALDAGEIVDGAIRCPRHGLCFALASGSSLGGDCADLVSHELVYEGNTLGIDE